MCCVVVSYSTILISLFKSEVFCMDRVYCFFAMVMFSMPAFSWVESVNVSIDAVMMWEGADTGNTHFKLSNGRWCYVPGTQKNLHTLVLATYAAGKQVHIVCHDVADSNAGGSVEGAHRLHKITALKD